MSAAVNIFLKVHFTLFETLWIFITKLMLLYAVIKKFVIRTIHSSSNDYSWFPNAGKARLWFTCLLCMRIVQLWMVQYRKMSMTGKHVYFELLTSGLNQEETENKLTRTYVNKCWRTCLIKWNQHVYHIQAPPHPPPLQKKKEKDRTNRQM